MPGANDQRSAGLAARQKLPPAELAAWQPGPDRLDPVALIADQAASRIPELVPVRHGRMAVSPFTYYRGAALPMAADLASLPTTGITVQLCGDAHLSNFGLFASPERDLVFDINDFDETLHGPFEWDIRRLAASLVVAARSRAFDNHAGHQAVHRMAQMYRTRMLEYASLRAIDVYYAHVDIAAVLGYVDKRARPLLEHTVRAARHHDALHELPRLTEVDAGGRRRIIDSPPMIVHVPAATTDGLATGLASYLDTLQEDRRELVERYRLIDMARKVVGVGSVGLEAFVALFLRGDGDPLFLQGKEAQASVLERFLGPSRAPSHGARVVAGQRRLQATSDILLGWATVAGGRDWYLRQLQDQKGGAVIEAMTPEDLATWGELCGWALARGHARSGEPAMMAAYLGTDGAFEHAITRFASAYADQNERDHAAFSAAIHDGRLAAEAGA